MARFKVERDRSEALTSHIHISTKALSTSRFFGFPVPLACSFTVGPAMLNLTFLGDSLALIKTIVMRKRRSNVYIHGHSQGPHQKILEDNDVIKGPAAECGRR